MCTTATRYPLGTVLEITGDTEVHIGTLGELVHDNGYWYRLRIDNGPVVLFRHEHVKPAGKVRAHALRVRIREMHVKARTEMVQIGQEFMDGPEMTYHAAVNLAQAIRELASVTYGYPKPTTEDRPWVRCRVCRYEKRLGDKCGEPCL